MRSAHWNTFKFQRKPSYISIWFRRFKFFNIVLANFHRNIFAVNLKCIFIIHSVRKKTEIACIKCSNNVDSISWIWILKKDFLVKVAWKREREETHNGWNGSFRAYAKMQFEVNSQNSHNGISILNNLTIIKIMITTFIKIIISVFIWQNWEIVCECVSIHC